MQHLVTGLLLILAYIAYLAGVGPFYGGQPILGSALLIGGLLLEVSFWLRLRQTRNRLNAQPQQS